MVQPAQWMRYYAARSRETLRRAAVIFAVVLPAGFIFGVMFVGVGGQVLYPLQYDNDGQLLGPHQDVGAYDQILVVFLRDFLPQLLGPAGVVLASLVIVAVMAASMSTADSSLHALSAVSVRDVYDRFVRPGASERERIFAGRAVIVLATVLAVVFVLADEWRFRETGQQYQFMKHIAILGLVAISFTAQLLPLTFDMLFFRKGTRAGAICGLAAGLTAAFLFGGLFLPVVAAVHDVPDAGKIVELRNNGSGHIRLTSSNFALLTDGDTIQIRGVKPPERDPDDKLPENASPAEKQAREEADKAAAERAARANGTWFITKVDDRTVDLESTRFEGPYASGGNWKVHAWTENTSFAAWNRADNAPLLVRLYLLLAGFKKALPIHASAWGLLANIPIFLLVSLLTSKVAASKREEFARLIASK